MAPEVIESIRAEAFAHAEKAFAEQRAACDKKLHLARVRVAELEQRAKRAEAENDNISTQLTLVEVQKAEVEKARDVAEEKLSHAENGSTDRVSELETEINHLRTDKEEMESMKKTVMILASELKRRMREDGTTLIIDNDPVKDLARLRAEAESPEDTDYVTDSRSGSDSE